MSRSAAASTGFLAQDRLAISDRRPSARRERHMLGYRPSRKYAAQLAAAKLQYPIVAGTHPIGFARAVRFIIAIIIPIISIILEILIPIF
jgi:hypothetical protein